MVDHLRAPEVEQYAKLLAEKRKHKGVSVEKAKELLEDPNYYACLMAAAGDADGMVSGSTTSTANTIRPALQVSPTHLTLLHAHSQKSHEAHNDVCCVQAYRAWCVISLHTC